MRKNDAEPLADFMGGSRPFGSATSAKQIRKPKQAGIELFRKVVREELDKLAAAMGTQAYAAGNYEHAATLIDRITTAPEFGTFITLPAYQEIN